MSSSLVSLTSIFKLRASCGECQTSPSILSKLYQPLLLFHTILIQLFLYFPPGLLYFPYSIHNPQEKLLLAVNIPTKFVCFPHDVCQTKRNDQYIPKLCIPVMLIKILLLLTRIHFVHWSCSQTCLQQEKQS